MRIGDMLVKAKLIDEMQLQAALAQQRNWGGKLGDILVDQGMLDEMMLWLGLSKQLDVPLVSLPELVIPPDVLPLVAAETCEKLEIFPVMRDERTLTVATSDPNNVGALDEVAFRTGLKVKTVLAPQREVAWAVRTYYQGERAPCPPAKMRRQLNTPEPPAEPTFQTAPPSSPNNHAATPLHEVAFTAPPKSNPGWQTSAEDQLRQANEMLSAVIELCVQRGVFTRDELWQRLMRR
jgi:type IV pilus assembly protein PilB